MHKKKLFVLPAKPKEGNQRKRDLLLFFSDFFFFWELNYLQQKTAEAASSRTTTAIVSMEPVVVAFCIPVVSFLPQRLFFICIIKEMDGGAAGAFMS